jgi:hypothetical protein
MYNDFRDSISLMLNKTFNGEIDLQHGDISTIVYLKMSMSFTGLDGVDCVCSEFIRNTHRQKGQPSDRQ